jgi:DNA-binding transcriptional MerR regulator
MARNDALTIREAAEVTGIGEHTLRYYERIALLEPIQRNASGHRRYRREDLGWIELLTCLRQTGMPIRAMQQFAAWQREGDPTGEKRKALLEQHQRDVQERQREIAGYLERIGYKVEAYRAMVEETTGVPSPNGRIDERTPA